MHNSTQYFVIYDPPHLIKSIRNNLHKSGLKCGTSEVSWKYVEAFYAHDCKLPIRMAPKLTDKHIKLPPFAALRVKLATQVMSHSVAAVIRGKGGHRDNPDIGQFNSALLQVIVDSLMVASTRKSCKDDLDVFVFGLQNIASSSTPELATTQTNVYPAFNLQENVLPSLLNVQQANVLAYIAGYICHRIAPKMCRIKVSV
ncbi:transposable element p transposase [Plakobranchus ocellatus]|uniref:Transposable element p transposase n=1 Tax=Plakobranchus ocellatus TaxID=259542 RepID=A0AAV3Z3S9_9GAST|nr:transposable element p transposase [Plakobranchus ocellatus]